jgi:hypothetical protein
MKKRYTRLILEPAEANFILKMINDKRRKPQSEATTKILNKLKNLLCQ